MKVIGFYLLVSDSGCLSGSGQTAQNAFNLCSNICYRETLYHFHKFSAHAFQQQNQYHLVALRSSEPRKAYKEIFLFVVFGKRMRSRFLKSVILAPYSEKRRYSPSSNSPCIVLTIVTPWFRFPDQELRCTLQKSTLFYIAPGHSTANEFQWCLGT